MTDRADEHEPHVLRWGCVLGTFDLAALAELSGADAATLRRLIDRGSLTPNGQGRYRLHDQAQRQSLADLRRERPRDEIRLHEAALAHFLGALGRPEVHAEDAAIGHLVAIHDLSIEYMEWELPLTHTRTMRAAHRWGASALTWIAFVEAYAAVRTERFAEGLRGLEALRDRADLDAALQVRVLHACSLPAADSGRYDEAIQLCVTALRIAEDLGDRFRQGYLLLSIAIIYNDLEDHPRALDYCERSLAHFRAIGADYRLAHALYETGNNAMRLGRWQHAGQAFGEAEEYYLQLGATRRLGMTRWAQGWLHQQLGEAAQAERAYQQTLEIALDPSYGIPTAAMDAYAQLGLLYQTQRRYAESATCMARATDIARRFGRRHYCALYLYRLAEALQGDRRYQEAAAAYREAVECVEELRTATEIEELKLSLLGTAQYIYESLVLFCLDHETEAAAFNYVEQARARAFLDTLARQAPALYASFEQPTATLAEVQARLGAGDVLIEYFTTGMLPPGDHPLHHIPSQNSALRQQLVPRPQILIFAITSSTLVVHRVQVDPNRLRPSAYAVDPVLHALQAEGRFRWLYDQLLGPVAGTLAGCRHLYIVPHGPLHYVPFGALLAPDGEHLVRAGGPAIAIEPSATVLIRHCLGRPRRRGRRGVAIGFDDRQGAPLAYAEAEARHVAGLMGGEAWTGSHSKSAELAAIGPELSWLHVAGHAIYEHESSLMSRLRLGQDDELDAGTVMNTMQLGADLVTLSSCMSGFSRVVPGDELLGLQRAFLYAGATTVVCALARTRDAVALLVMDEFYRRLRRKYAKAAALRDALVAVRTMPRARVVRALRRLGYEPVGAEADFMGPSDTDSVAVRFPFAHAEFWAPFMLIGSPD